MRNQGSCKITKLLDQHQKRNDMKFVFHTKQHKPLPSTFFTEGPQNKRNYK